MGFDILDASAFYAGVPFGAGGRWYTTPQVLGEVSHIKKEQDAIEAIIDIGRLTIMQPQEGFVRAASRAASRTGDSRLSAQDMSVIALAIETGGRIVTDDFAVSNVAGFLDIKVMPVMTAGIRHVGRWIHYCPACRKNFRDKNECPVCGTVLKRKLLRR